MQFTSLDTWPFRNTPDRRNSPYRAGYKDTLKLLEKEIDNLSGTKIVVGLDLAPSDIRNDGWPRANARPGHPGVVVSFDTRRLGAMRIHCDTFLDFKDNLRAIAHHLEHLRLAGLYGVGKDDQQYQGWRALPAPAQADFKGPKEAAEFICQHSEISQGVILTPAGGLDIAYRRAAAKLHPDVGGDAEQFKLLGIAKKMVEDSFTASL